MATPPKISKSAKPAKTPIRRTGSDAYLKRDRDVPPVPPFVAQEAHAYAIEVKSSAARLRTSGRVPVNTLVINVEEDVGELLDQAKSIKAPVFKAWLDMLPLIVERMASGKEEALQRAAQAYRPQAEFGIADLDRLEMQKKASESIIRGTSWLRAADIGNFGNRSPSNPGALANRWKKEKKVFALKYEGTDKYPCYQFDEQRLEPLPVIAKVIALFGDDADPWRIAAWFESSNAWLDAKRPREMLDQPGKVLEAARNKDGWRHG